MAGRKSHQRAPLWALVFGGMALTGCGARDPLAEDGSGGASSADVGSATGGRGTGGQGGDAVPLSCGPDLFVQPAALLDVAGGAPRQVSAVFGTNSGQVVSLFHGWTSPSGSASLRVSTLEPWAAWPPAPGEAFVFDPDGGASFALANVGYGEAAVVFEHTSIDGVGLHFVPSISATSATGLLTFELAPEEVSPYAVAVVSGYDEPPVAFNVGYLASLAVWGLKDEGSDAHALRFGVGTSGVATLSALVQRPDEQDLACASSPVAADGVRVGDAWWVFAGSGSPLGPCSMADAGAPTSLVFDALDWGDPGTVDWTLSRIATVKGEGSITRVAAAAVLDGAWVLVGREGQAQLELLRFDGSGVLAPASRAPNADVTAVMAARLVALADGLVLAYVDAASPTSIELELLDRTGALRGRAQVDGQGSVASLSALPSKDGAALLLSWTTDEPSPRLFVARADCEGAP